MVERRKHARYKVRDGFIAIPHNSRILLGKIRDISQGGLTVRYFEKKEWKCEPIEIDIVLSDVDFSLDSIPIEITYDMEQNIQTPYRVLYERQCGLKFGELTEQQVAQLNDYLHDFAASPA